MTSASTPSSVKPGQVEFYAGQTIFIGYIRAYLKNTATDPELCIQYDLTEPSWYLKEVHLWVGTDTALIPQNRQGNWKLGLFPVNQALPAGTTQFESCKKLSEIISGDPCDKIVFVLAHAAVFRIDPTTGEQVQEETAYGNVIIGDRNRNWGTFFDVTIQCDAATDPPNNPNSRCETTWAFRPDVPGLESYTFIERGLSSKWGWVLCSAPVTWGKFCYTVDIWGGAGQNNLTKGTDTGDAEFCVDCTSSPCKVTVTYNMDDNTGVCAAGDAILKEAHLRVNIGPNVYTVAPGQYEHKQSFDPAVQTYDFGGPITQACNTDYTTGVCTLADINAGDTVCIAAHGVACVCV